MTWKEYLKNRKKCKNQLQEYLIDSDVFKRLIELIINNTDLSSEEVTDKILERAVDHHGQYPINYLKEDFGIELYEPKLEYPL